MRSLRQIIFIISLFFVCTSAFNQVYGISFQQTKTIPGIRPDSTRRAAKDTTIKIKKTSKSGPSAPVSYSADTIRTLKDKDIVILDGNARVIYEDFEMDAAYIVFNKKTNNVFARGDFTTNLNRPKGRPIFKQKGEKPLLADSLNYNTKTQKGKIYNQSFEQDGGYFTGGQAKKHDDEEVHLKDVIYSTCNLPHPHFGIHITRGIATENKIITGPAFIEFEGIPLPIALPFGFFPKPNKRSSGIIFPTFGEDNSRGFYLRDFGYYIGLSDYWEATLKGSVYTKGGFDASSDVQYTKRYKYNGSIGLRFSNVPPIGVTEGSKNYKFNNEFNITWSHSQNPNAKPGTTFSASVNAGTSSYFANTAAAGTNNIGQIATQSMNSSISYGRVFGDGKYNLTAGFLHNQNTRDRSISLQLPSLNFSVASFNPFDSKTRVGEQKWYQRINMGYTLSGNNSINTVDTLLFKKGALTKLKTSFSHNIPIGISVQALKYFTFSLSGTYNEKWAFQTFRQRYITQRGPSFQDSLARDTVSGFKRYGEYSWSGNVSTKFYGTYNFKGKKLMAIRHLITPNLSFSYRPDFSSYYQDIIDTKTGKAYINRTPGPNFGQTMQYSVFEGTDVGAPSRQRSGSIGLSIDNTIEAKIRSKTDTTNGGIKKIPIIQGLNFSTSYNLFGTSFKLAPISFSGRAILTDKIDFQFSGSLDPYLAENVDYIDPATQATTTVLQRVDRYVWTKGKLPRLTNFNTGFNLSLNPEAFKQKNKNIANERENTLKNATPDQAEKLAMISRDPNAFVDFNVPWNMTLGFNFNYSNPLGNKSTIVSTVNISGDFSLTPKWKITGSTGYEFASNQITTPQIGIYRDLHCWDMAINWIPVGAYKSYNVTIKVKAAILQDLKLTKRSDYYNPRNGL